MKEKFGNILIMLILLIVMLLGENYYIVNMRNSLWNQSVADVLEVTNQGGHAFEVYIEKDLDMVSNLAERLSAMDSQDTEKIENLLTMMAETDVFYSVVNLESGIVYSNVEDAITLSEDKLAVFRDMTSIGVVEPYLNDYTGENTLGYYVQFTFADGVAGVVRKGQLISTVSDEFSLSFYDDAGFSYVVSGAGKILIRPNHKNSNRTYPDILDVIEAGDNDPDEVATFRSDLAGSTERGVAKFWMDGEEYVVAYVPIAHTEGWDLVTLIPSAVITEYTNQLLQTSQVIIFVIGVGLLMLAAVIIIVHQNYQKLLKKDRELQYQRQLFSILASNTNDVYLMLGSEDFHVEYISPNVERVLGITAEEVRADVRTLSNAVYNKDSPTVTYSILQEMRPEDTITRECERIHRVTGEKRWFEENVYRATIDDSDRFIAVLTDRTADRQNRQTLEAALKIAQAANDSKSVFLSSMSHDIRTPMNAIVGLATLLQRDAESPDRVREHTRKIAASSQHLLGLINDVLDMSKIESGKTTLNIGEISLPELTEELYTIMRTQTKARHQKFSITTQGVTSDYLLGDKLRINQVLINILSNAVKYTQEGGEIHMTVQQLPQLTRNYNRLRFIISDNGMGMAPEYLDTIFQPFTRENTARISGIQGTGLGMAITKSLVDLMGGTISVESELGKGSTFTVDLELRIQDKDIDPDFWKKHGVTHALVVDDEEEICESVIYAMDGTGIKMEYALSGRTAVDMVRQADTAEQGFNLILLDWKMPDMNGIETAKQIRQIVPAHVPIMVLTAYDWSSIEEEALAAGIDGFLPKPFFLSNFRLTIESLWKQRAVSSEEPPVTAGSSVLEGMHFLAAEDNELNAEILTELLDIEGATCEIAVDGQKVLERFQQSKTGEFDMILMDIQMPVMNGYEAARSIRSCEHPLALTIPIIAMTANAFAEDVRDALASGMNAHISKPVDMERLKEVVQQILDGTL